MGTDHFARGRTQEDHRGLQEPTLNARFRREFVRFTKFSAVGVIGAVVDFGTFNLFRGLLGVPATLAQAISFGAAVTNNFLWNRFWTYPDSRSKPIGRQASQFLIVSLIGLAVRTAAFVLLTPAMIALAHVFLQALSDSSTAAQAITLGENLALAVAVVVVLLWNFLVNRYWTYSDVQ